MAGGRDEEPQSPCIGLCQLDASSVCLGCGRHVDEIAQWGFVADERKWEILAAARERRHVLKTGRTLSDDTDDTSKED